MALERPAGVSLRTRPFRNGHDRRPARPSGHHLKIFQRNPDLAGVDRLDLGLEDVDDLDVGGVERPGLVAPADRDDIAFGQAGVFGHPDADQSGNIAAVSTQAIEGELQDGSGPGSTPLRSDGDHPALGIDRPGDDQDGGGPSGGRFGGQLGRNDFGRILDRRRVVGVVGPGPVLAAAGFLVDRDFGHLLVHALEQALAPDDGDERKGQDEGVQPGFRAVSDQVAEGELRDDHGRLLMPERARRRRPGRR